jgi:uncharacterized BrkB/YihY/UPF0761 family membrane protein
LKDIALRTFRDVGENRIMRVSAGITFFALFAICPAVAALVSVYGLVADASTINDQLASCCPSRACKPIPAQPQAHTDDSHLT